MTRAKLVHGFVAAFALLGSLALPASVFAIYIPVAAPTWVSINEFASHLSSGNDWVELYNASSSPIDLTGWTLKDLAGNTHTFSGTIAAGGFATTSFGDYLNNSGDEMFLVDTTGATSSDVAYGSATSTASAGADIVNFAPGLDQSAYRTTDGGSTWATTKYPTEGYSNVPCAAVPPSTTPAVDATFHVASDPDSGNVGDWATDTFDRHMQIWQAADGSYCARADDSGTFTSYGAPSGISPDSGAALPEVVTGSFTGYTYGTVTGGTLNASAGTPADLDCAGADAATCSAGTIAYWIDNYFGSGATYNYGDGWSWTYDGGVNGTWVDAASGTSGDIVHVQPTTVYVDPTLGSDSNYGDAAHPMQTVDAAMAAVADNGTVELVATTTPYSSITITRPITITSADSANKAQLVGAVTIAADGVTVSDLDITNPSAGYGIIGTDVSSTTVSGNTIHDIGTTLATGSAQAIAFISSAKDVSNLDIEHNAITNVGSTNLLYNGSAGSSAKGVYLGNSSGSNTFSDVTVSGNTMSDIYASTADWKSLNGGTQGGAGAYGLLVNHKTSNLTVSGNTISTLEGLWAHAIGLEADTPGAVVSSNTVSGLTDHKGGTDSMALRLESNPDASTVTGSGNTFGGTPLDIGRGSIIVDPTAGTVSGDTYPETLAGGAYYYAGINILPTIASAVAAASSGATVTVESGIYPESVVISHPLTLNASGATLTGTSTESYILEISGTGGVTVNGLAVDGGGAAPGDNSFAEGVLVSNAGTDSSPVTLANLSVKNIWSKGAQAAIDVSAATVGGSYAIVHDTQVSNFTKRGIRYTHADGTVHDSTVTGHPVDGTNYVQNLLNLWGGSTVEAYNNTLEGGYSTTSGTWDSPAVFVSSYDGATNSHPSSGNIHNNVIYSVDTGVTVGSYYAPGDSSTATVADNTFHDVHTAVNFEQGTASATVNGNSFGANVDYGVNADDGNSGPSSKPSPDATKNWWGDASGPTVSSNAGGTGAATYDGVSYAPWYADSGMTTLKWPTNSSGGEASTTVSTQTTLTGSDGGVSVSATIPAGTVVTGDASWDGTIEAPTASSTSLSLDGSTVTTDSAVEVGSSKYDLLFSAPVELTFTGEAGKKVGFYDAAGTFSEITENCDGVGTPTVGGHDLATTSPGEACKIDSGSDLVVWTTHFSTFVTYTSVPNAPIITPDGATFHGFVDVTMDDTAAGATIRYTTDGTDPTCSSGSGYANGQVLVFNSAVTLKAMRCETGGAVFSSIASATFSPAAGGGGGGGGGGSISTPATPASGPGTTATPPAATPGHGGEVLGAAAYNFTQDLHLGMSGTDVTELQKFLIASGFDIPAITKGGQAYGYFGGQTLSAVIAFQKANGITPAAGYVGALTRAVLNSGVISTTPEHQTNLSADQANAIVGLLESFGADASVVAKVKAALGI